MSKDPNRLQRLGGGIVLVVAALMLALASQAPSVRSFFEFEPQELSASQARPASPSTDRPADTIAAGSAAAAFDLGSLPVLRDSSLVPNPIAVTYKPKSPSHTFITYTVKAGDTAIGIAQQFGIQEETLLGGNEFLSTDAAMLQPGAVLVILPVDGVLHTVKEGEALEDLAGQFGVPVEDIIAYAPNNLEFPFRLLADTQILIPGAVREAFFWEPPVAVVTASSGGSPESLQGIYVANLGTGSFIWPIGSRNISQYYWYGHQGVDITASEGSAVYAADTGTVTYAAWSPYCYGNLIVINHGNGYETFYAHLSGFNVSPGQVVTKGNVIGASGNTGCSSGPHLHFEVRYNRGRYDPLSYAQ